jgi:predicted nucleic acid-binding protein
VIVLDTSVLVAAMNRADSHHHAVVDWIEDVSTALVTSPLAVAEMDHLVTRHGGQAAARALHDDIDRGAYRVEWWPASIYETIEVARDRAPIGLTDASLVVLAARLGTTQIATLDERHFRGLEPLTGEPAFVLLAADAD